MDYATAIEAVVPVEHEGQTLKKIKYESAVEFLADPDKTKADMVKYFTGQDKQ